MLRRAVLRLFGWMPADRRRIEQHLRAAERRQARAFGIPLVPADQRRDARVTRVEAAEAQIAGREVILLEYSGSSGMCILRYSPSSAPSGIDDHRRVVKHARHAPLEDRADDHHVQLARPACVKLSVVGPGNGLGKIEQLAVFSRQKYCERNSSWTQMICAPLRGGLADSPFGLGEILVGIERAGHLDQADAELGLRHKTIVAALGIIDELQQVAYRKCIGPWSYSISTAPWCAAPDRTIGRRWSTASGGSPGIETTTEGIPVQGMLDPDILTVMMRAAGVRRESIRRGHAGDSESLRSATTCACARS